jgi:curved DNA-binding protein
MQKEDLYLILGVASTATEGEIKKAYRKLARELHPDKNKGNKDAEERFKKVSAAYAVLGNAEKRKLYDKYGIDGLRDGFDPQMWERAQGFGRRGYPRSESADGPFDFGGFSGFGNMEDVFETLFGRNAYQRSARRHAWSPRATERGPDVKSQMEVALLDAVIGRELQIVVPVEGELKNLTVRIPRGLESGKSIRLKGQGGRGQNGGPNGDLLVGVGVKPDDIYRRQGLGLVKREDVTVGKAYFGGELVVETPWGKGTVRLPEGVRGGQRLRIKGHGIRGEEAKGDLFVEINIVLPEAREEKVAKAVRDLESFYSER